MLSSGLKWEDLYPNKKAKPKSIINMFDNIATEHDLEIETNNDSFNSVSVVDKAATKRENSLIDAKTIFGSQISFPTTFKNLDFLLPRPFLLEGCLTLFHTPDKAGRSFILQLFLALMLQYYEQGVIFIDCTNVFPAYELIEATLETRPSIDPQLPIRAVQLSRSFNYHQATETVKEQLEPLLRDGFSYNISNEFADTPKQKFVKPKMVIVAGLSDLYLNQESAQYLEYDQRPPWWSIFELQETIGYLRSLTLKYNSITIISSSSDPRSRNKPLGGRYLGHSSAVIVRLATEGMALYGQLIKHPFVGYRELLIQILKKKGKKRATMPLKSFFN